MTKSLISIPSFQPKIIKYILKVELFINGISRQISNKPIYLDNFSIHRKVTFSITKLFSEFIYKTSITFYSEIFNLGARIWL